MANKEKVYSNEAFIRIAGTFSNYKNDLTPEAKKIIVDTIKDNMRGSSKPYKAERIYYVIINTLDFSRDRVRYWLQHWYGKQRDPDAKPVGDETVRKIKTVSRAVANALVEADSQGIRLFKKKEEGMYYLSPVQHYEMDKMQDEGLSAQEMIKRLEAMIAESENGK